MQNISTQELLQDLIVDVRVYGDGATHTQWQIDGQEKLSVLVELDNDGDWLVSLWHSNPDETDRVSTSKILYEKFRTNYLILTTACAQALYQLQGNADFLKRFRVGSNDEWVRMNFVKEWLSAFKDLDVRISLCNSQAPFGVRHRAVEEFLKGHS